MMTSRQQSKLLQLEPEFAWYSGTGEDKMDMVIEKLRAFNDAFMASYAD